MQLAFFFLISYSGERWSNTFNIQNILQNIQNVLLTVYLKIKQGHNRDVLKKHMSIFIPKPLAPLLKIFSCLPSFQNRNLKARMLEHGTVYALKPAWLQSFLSLLPFKLWWYIHSVSTADSDFSCHFIFYKVFTEFFTLSSSSSFFNVLGFVARRHVGSYFPNKDRTWVPSIGRWILNHQTTRKSQVLLFYWNTVLCTRNPAAWAKRVSSRAAPPTGRPHGSGHGGMPATCRSLLSRAFPISKKAKAGESHLMISNIFQGPGCSVKPQ